MHALKEFNVLSTLQPGLETPTMLEGAEPSRCGDCGHQARYPGWGRRSNTDGAHNKTKLQSFYLAAKCFRSDLRPRQ